MSLYQLSMGTKADRFGLDSPVALSHRTEDSLLLISKFGQFHLMVD